MDVHFISAYYSEKAHREITKRTPLYWEAYMFIWAVKTGKFHRNFKIIRKVNGATRAETIGPQNIDRARKSFGKFIASTLKMEGAPPDVALVPVPSKDALASSGPNYRSLKMLEEALDGSDFPGEIVDGVRWTEKLPKAHEDGHHNRDHWKQYLEVVGNVRNRSVVLIDDVLSTGGTMLAAKEVLEGSGANVIFAITCGRTVYDFETKAFSRQKITLEDEFHDYAPPSDEDI